MKVKVYRNLHKKCYSIVDRKTRKVSHHQHLVVLEAARFKVYQYGRIRVLREKKKNVHAYVFGNLISSDFEWPKTRPREAYYNPYKVDSFVDKKTKKTVTDAALVFLTGEKILYWSKR